MEFTTFWDIYTRNFPFDERRDLEDQKTLIGHPLYHLEPIHYEDKDAGFIAYWSLSDFVFIEHIAISDDYKGLGIASIFLKDFITNHKEVILEVEPPHDDISSRRIKFYEKLDFILNLYDYMQPPLSKAGKSIPLMIMSYPHDLDLARFEKIKHELYQVVYGV